MRNLILNKENIFQDDSPFTSGIRKLREELLHRNTPLPTDMISLVRKYLDREVKITAGGHHSLILLENGQVLSTGSNNYGQLGIGNHDNQTIPVLMNLGKNEAEKGQKAMAIAAGEFHSLILLESGQVLAAGYNDHGHLGSGNQNTQTIPVPMNLGKDREGKQQKAIAMAAGYYHSLILLENGQVLATGGNKYGQLGIGNHDNQTIPVIMNLGEKEQKAIAIAAGGFHNLILLENGQVLATGYNVYGQLGIGNHDNQTTPVPMNLGKNEAEEEHKATAMAAGDFYSLILLESGQVLATGANDYGQLGIGNHDNQTTSVLMNLGENKRKEKHKATVVVAGACHCLILLESGQVLATGSNGHGQLGIGNRDNQTTPVPMNLGKNKEGEEQKATAIAAGDQHSLILLKNGQVLVIDTNGSGRLDIANRGNQMTPVPMGQNEEKKEQKHNQTTPCPRAKKRKKKNQK